MDREIFEKFKDKKCQIVDDEHFVRHGIITEIFDTSIAFYTNGKTCYLSFDRILELRPLGGNHGR